MPEHPGSGLCLSLICQMFCEAFESTVPCIVNGSADRLHSCICSQLACCRGPEQQMGLRMSFAPQAASFGRGHLFRLTPERIWALVLADIISVRSIHLTTKPSDSFSRPRQQTPDCLCVSGSHSIVADRCWHLMKQPVLWTRVIAACFRYVHFADSMLDGHSGPDVRTNAWAGQQSLL